MPMGSYPNQMNNAPAGSLPGMPRRPRPQRLLAQGANAQTYGAQGPMGQGLGQAPHASRMAAPAQAPGTDQLRDQMSENVMGLLQGRNPAADQADRTAMTGISSMQKTSDAGLKRQAAAMGIQEGDPRMTRFMQQQGAQVQSMGSKLLGDATQKRLDDQARGLTTANSFITGQQGHELDRDKFGEDVARDQRNFGEDTRRYEKDTAEDTRRFDQGFASDEKTKEQNSLFDIINNPLSSEGQVEAAKQRLLQTHGGLDAGTFNKAEKNNAQRQFDEIRSYLEVMNPGMSPAELDNMARGRMGTLDDATFGALTKADGVDVNQATAGAGEKQTLGDRLLNPTGAVADATNLYTGGGVSGLQGATHAAGETVRGVRDIGRGDVLGGGSRILAAPAKGAAHAALQTGRTVARTGRRIKNLFS